MPASKRDHRRLLVGSLDPLSSLATPKLGNTATARPFGREHRQPIDRNRELARCLRRETYDMNVPTHITDGPERQMLEYMLDHTRAELIDTVRGLSETESRRRLVPSMTTSIGLVKHAAFAERKWFQHILGGLPESECDGAMVGEASFVVSDNETVADVIAEFERASNRARTIAANIDLDATRGHPAVGTVSLRWIYLLMIQEFARHAGHSDILREQTGATRRT
ncbi:DinB family protein [Saccharopolyspora shandongensis]|uniref:DinB family protein n=1 Tax=Saccharopolyspora shandongensis TaxID=418495 RepID=UPI00343BFD19